MKTLASILLVLILIIGGGAYYMGGQVKNGTQNVASKILGAPIKLDDISVSLLTGEITLRGVTVGNPEGYSDQSAMSYDRAVIEVDTFSLFSDVVKVNRVTVTNPAIHLEIAENGTTNFNVLQQRAAQVASLAGSTSDKRIRINEIAIADPALTVSSKRLGKQGSDTALMTINISNLGNESGATPSEIVNNVLKVVMQQTATVSLSELETIEAPADGLSDIAPAGGSNAATPAQNQE